MLEQDSAVKSVLASGTITTVRVPNSQYRRSVSVVIQDGYVHSIHDPTEAPEHAQSAGDGCRVDAADGLLAPSLCHPHVHLDKAFILSHPRYRHLQVTKGTFQEAMDLTSEAKKSFTRDDLLHRGQRLIEESWKAGVTHMRAFVEVDEIVGMTCLEAGAALKVMARDKGLCHVQLCVFAQLPLHPSDASGDRIRGLMQQAMQPQYLVDAVGSTPYVERDRKDELKNVQWMIDLALQHDKHLDFHLDYNVDQTSVPLIFDVVKLLKLFKWTNRTRKRIVFGHCTALIHFADVQWQGLASMVRGLPISLVGLPTSDLYMMKTASQGYLDSKPALRTTLPIPRIIEEFGINCAIGINNIGNAFTPHGVCDPLYLANLGIGLYQMGPTQGARLLYECVSTRARVAIGLAPPSHKTHSPFTLDILQGQSADLVLFPPPPEGFGSEHNVEDKVYYYSTIRRATFWSGH